MLLGSNLVDVLQHLAPAGLWQASLDWERRMYVIGANGESALDANDGGLGTARNVRTCVGCWSSTSRCLTNGF
jgi:hypothetical protein